jgi:hypothetical protein
MQSLSLIIIFLSREMIVKHIEENLIIIFILVKKYQNFVNKICSLIK